MTRPLLSLYILSLCLHHADSLQSLLSDVRTPSLLVDVQFLQRQLNKSALIPRLRLDNHHLLVPINVSIDCIHSFDANAEPFQALDSSIPSGLFYLHARVKRAKDEQSLATLDLPRNTQAHLVLGLNNHHVGGYYWARSVGSGAAMEAPGVELTHDSKLIWRQQESTTLLGGGSFENCNSNDGKRSEWVNFLKMNDQVQLLPHTPLDAALALSDCMFGVSHQGRPLGSEPAVVCQWRLERNNGQEESSEMLKMSK